MIHLSNVYRAKEKSGTSVVNSEYSSVVVL